MLSHLLVNDYNILPPLFLKEQWLVLKLYVRKNFRTMFANTAVTSCNYTVAFFENSNSPVLDLLT